MNRAHAVLVVLAGVFAVALAVWYELAHPCMHWEDRPSTCGGTMYCAYTDTNGACMFWITDPTYACTVKVCTERQ